MVHPRLTHSCLLMTSRTSPSSSSLSNRDSFCGAALIHLAPSLLLLSPFPRRGLSSSSIVPLRMPSRICDARFADLTHVARLRIGDQKNLVRMIKVLKLPREASCSHLKMSEFEQVVFVLITHSRESSCWDQCPAPGHIR